MEPEYNLSFMDASKFKANPMNKIFDVTQLSKASLNKYKDYFRLEC